MLYSELVLECLLIGEDGSEPPMTVKLTPEEIRRYAPYHTFPEFWDGFDDYNIGKLKYELSGIAGQAYYRGVECATRRKIAERSRQRPPVLGLTDT